MKAVYKEMIDSSLGAMLSAIEIYNKPDFKYRNETFAVLAINAWELILKAKVLKDNHNNKTALFCYDGRRIKRSRTGNPLTIEIKAAMKKLSLDPIMCENLDNILEIRDTSIHFYNKDAIEYTIFALGAACLQNYKKILADWFAVDLSKYNFYILPLGFKYDFRSFSLMDVSNEPDAIQRLVRGIVERQESDYVESNGFYLVADIKAEVVSARKVAGPKAVIAVDGESDKHGIIRIQKPTDRYPYTFTEVWQRVREELPVIKQSQLNHFIKIHDIKNDPKYSTYSFTVKAQEDEFKRSGLVPKSTRSIYNEEAMLFILGNL